MHLSLTTPCPRHCLHLATQRATAHANARAARLITLVVSISPPHCLTQVFPKTIPYKNAKAAATTKGTICRHQQNHSRHPSRHPSRLNQLTRAPSHMFVDLAVAALRRQHHLPLPQTAQSQFRYHLCLPTHCTHSDPSLPRCIARPKSSQITTSYKNASKSQRSSLATYHNQS